MAACFPKKKQHWTVPQQLEAPAIVIPIFMQAGHSFGVDVLQSALSSLTLAASTASPAGSSLAPGASFYWGR